jgi:hypothetical protein
VEEIKKLEDYARDLSFEPVLTPRHVANDVLATIARGKRLTDFYENYEVDVSPPTDDRPFFFQMLRARDVLSPDVWDSRDVNWKNLKAVLVLMTLLGIVIVLTTLCIVVPLLLKADRKSLRGGTPLMTYFGAIGFGFMFIEVAQMQRLSLFLGHPTYALSVVLFTLLLGGGIGSFLAGEWLKRRNGRALRTAFAVLLAVLFGLGFATPMITGAFAGAETPTRIALSVLLLLPAGITMGMPFPLGMRRADEQHRELSPWLWGINGATSVCASVVAIVIALTSGIAGSYWVGVAFYVVAATLYVVVTRPSQSPAPGPAAS